ncbi:transcriptional regulator [Paracoccus sp. p4-l81]|uniref:helix-turn-helix domain-containing protein n=1 Tax=Paracoccus sp. p4-l81 TaxID=3342806 RepID=UPI0035B96FFA
MTTTYPEHEKLKMELRLRGSSMTQIAADVGVQPGSVTAVSQGIRRSRKIEAALAAAVGTTPEILFPCRYAKEGSK